MAKVPYQSSLPELVRKLEHDYVSGTTTISKHVQFSMLDTLNRIDAYLNSKHITGDKDSLDREKPFFNIVIAASNIWYRATDIDRKDIRIKPTKSKDEINALLATYLFQEWMRKENFGSFLNEWGRVLARYGSAVVKFVENSDGFHPMVIPWNRIICDQIDFNNNVKIELIELTEAQLRQRKGYNQEIVEKLCNALKSRETVDKQRKDNKNDYIRLYEVTGDLPKSYLTGDDKDKDDYATQMHVVSFIAKKDKHEFDEYTLQSGPLAKDPYMITHLIKEDGRTLAIGAVEHLFESQWMMNHTQQNIKDQLDLASKLIFQTADVNFVGQNALTAIETGDILIHSVNMPLTQVDNSPRDIAALQNFGAQWKALANEITGISEAMLGAQPKSGTAWRQTQALLQESYSLFELMIENKGIHLEEMIRTYVLPYYKRTQLNSKEEVAATLALLDIDRIDAKYIKNKSVKLTNKIAVDRVLAEEDITPEEQQAILQANQEGIQGELKDQGLVRFFKPSELDDTTWKEQFKNMEWDLEIDVSGEATDPDAITTLDTLLKFIVQKQGMPMSPEERLIFNRILEKTAIVSPLQLSSLRQPTPIQPQPLSVVPNGGSGAGMMGIK